MVLTMWAVRESNERLDMNGVYDGHLTLFTIELRHGGRFTRVLNMKYIEGTLSYVDCVDIDVFSVHELDAMMLELGYVVPPVIYYHFRIPNEGLQFGLRALANDDDVRVLYPFVEEHKVIKVYTEHGSTNLLTYFMAPPGPRRVIIQDLDDQEPVQAQDQPIEEQPIEEQPIEEQHHEPIEGMGIKSTRFRVHGMINMLLTWVG